MSANKELDSTYQIQSQNEHKNGKIGESNEKEIAENQNESQSWWIREWNQKVDKFHNSTYANTPVNYDFSSSSNPIFAEDKIWQMKVQGEQYKRSVYWKSGAKRRLLALCLHREPNRIIREAKRENH